MPAKMKMRKLMNKMDNMVIGIRHGFGTHAMKKENGINGLIVEIAIIAVAVVLLVLFNTQIREIVTSVITTMSASIKDMLKAA